MEQKRGQVTLFIIMGVALLLLLGFLMFSSNLSQSIIDKKPKGDFIAVNDFVEGCLNEVATKGLLHIKDQGGHIFVSQSGLTPDTVESLAGIGVNIPYAINTPAVAVSEYPWTEFPYRDAAFSEPLQFKRDEAFGNYSFPTLPEINASFKSYIEQKLPECLNAYVPLEDQFAIQENAGLSVNPVLDAASDVEVQLLLPLTAQLKGSNKSKTFDTFAVRYPIRFKQMHELASEALMNESSDVLYDIRYINRSGMEIRKQVDVDGKDDTLYINDTVSMLKGVNYGMTVSLKNRPPALHFIKHNFYTLCITDRYFEPEYVYPRIAYDPDEEDVEAGITFSFEGPPDTIPREVISAQNLDITTVRVSDGDPLLDDRQLITATISFAGGYTCT